MSNRLRKNELCPIHKSFWCCGREKPPGNKKVSTFKGPVQKVEDLHHPRGYRIVCSKPELKKRKHKLLAEGPLECIHCGQSVRFLKDSGIECEYADIELCHREPCGFHGAKRDDDWTNIGLGHRTCNSENGSKRVA